MGVQHSFSNDDLEREAIIPNAVSQREQALEELVAWIAQVFVNDYDISAKPPDDDSVPLYFLMHKVPERFESYMRNAFKIAWARRLMAEHGTKD